MKCPFCSAADTKVIDSRPAEDNSSIRRRRQCVICGKRFTTYEKLETMPLMVIKKDQTREPYDRSKIEAGVVHSCHKRPVSTQQINQMIDEIENEHLLSALEKLSDEDLELLTLYIYEGYSTVELSKAYGIAHQNISKRIIKITNFLKNF